MARAEPSLITKPVVNLLGFWPLNAGGRLARSGPAIGLPLFGAVVVLLYVRPVWSILAHLPFNYNEGWNAYSADAAIIGGALDPPRDALISNNCPPLSFFVVGGRGQPVGDNIIAGRFISLISLYVVAGNVVLVLSARGAARTHSIFGAILFLCCIGGLPGGLVAVDEPQWLGHALNTTGLCYFCARATKSQAFGAGWPRPA